MRISDIINEAPIASYDLHGDWGDRTSHHEASTEHIGGKNSFLSKYDRALVQNPRIQERLSKLLSGCPHPIHLMFWNSKSALRFLNVLLDYGAVNYSVIKYFPNEIKKKISAMPKDAIGIILTNNDGGSARHPLTPWMMVHRISHALFPPMIVQREIASEIRNCYEIEILDNHVRPWRSGPILPSQPDQGYVKEWLRLVNTFKAARENKLLNFPETITEMYTQYLIKGTVILQEPPEIFEVQTGQGVGSYTIRYTCVDKEGVERAMNWLKDRISSSAERVLHHALGKTFVC